MNTIKKSNNIVMKAIIVEDERNNSELLTTAIRKYINGVEVVGIGENVQDSIRLILETKPDLIFLDIELPDGSGFDVLDGCREVDFKIIFITAYNQYAIKAIKYAAMDYLLKPLNIDELEIAIQRIQNSYNTTIKPNLNYLIKQLDQQTTIEENKIIIPTVHGYQNIKINDIVAIEAESNYVFFILNNQTKYLATNPISFYEELLSSDVFYRIHRSHMINFTKVLTITTGRMGKVIMTNNMSFNIAARRKCSFQIFMDKFNNKI